MSTRRKREAPKPPRPLSKPPPPPKPERLSGAETAAQVHCPPPHTGASPPHPGVPPPPPPSGVPPPYTEHAPTPTRPAPPPPSAPGVDTLQRPPPSGGPLPAKYAPPGDDVITPVSAPEVHAGVGRYNQRPQDRSRKSRVGADDDEDIELEFVGGRTGPGAAQRVTLLPPDGGGKRRETYDPLELPPPDYFILSLITCLCCCLPIGLVALVFSICSSNSSGMGKTTRGRRLGNVALALSILGILAALGTALGLYYSGTGEVLYHKIRALLVANDTQPAASPGRGEQGGRGSQYQYEQYSYHKGGGGDGGGSNYAYQYDANY